MSVHCPFLSIVLGLWLPSYTLTYVTRKEQFILFVIYLLQDQNTEKRIDCFVTSHSRLLGVRHCYVYVIPSTNGCPFAGFWSLILDDICLSEKYSRKCISCNSLDVCKFNILIVFISEIRYQS